MSLKDIEKYYTSKLTIHGATPKGVDWNSEESQNLRFKQLLKLVTEEQNYSILDYGCGYGALCSFIDKDSTYTGFDISSKMLEIAMKRNPNHQWLSKKPNHTFDYVVASGLFNVKLNHNDFEWREYIITTIQEFNNLCSKGFAFNLLSSYSDKEKHREDLHYANPLELFDYCKTNFSKYVSLIHDYPLYEFTILVKKE